MVERYCKNIPKDMITLPKIFSIIPLFGKINALANPAKCFQKNPKQGTPQTLGYFPPLSFCLKFLQIK